MTTINSTELPTPSPEMPDGDSQSESPRRGVSRGLLAATVAAVAAITGGVLWLTAGSGGNDNPTPDRVQIVQDGRWGGPDVYEHGARPDGSFGTTDQRFG